MKWHCEHSCGSFSALSSAARRALFHPVRFAREIVIFDRVRITEAVHSAAVIEDKAGILARRRAQASPDRL